MLQAPPTQVGEPLTVLQAASQPPQLLTSLLVGVSQPLRAMFSSAEQSSYPELQAMLQMPPEQAGAPLTVLHAASHPPQLAVSVLRLISQPLFGLPSQSSNPAAQLYWQAPSEHPAETMFGGALSSQSWPQLPQFEALVFRLASQPFPLRPSQLSKPASQVWSHAPATQAGAALAQSSGQTVAQFPHRVGSLSVCDSQPSRAAFSSAEQSLQPAAQLVMLQLPAMQLGAPLTVLHGAAQPPQLPSSVLRLVSQPSAVPPEQSPQPASHTPMLQVLALQVPVAFG